MKRLIFLIILLKPIICSGNTIFNEIFIYDKSVELDNVFGILDLKVDKNGRFFVIGRGEENVKIFSQRGDIIKVIGRKGEGPGEFTFPRCISVKESGEFCVGDMLTRRVSFFNSEGKFVNSIVCPSVIARMVWLNSKLIISGIKQVGNSVCFIHFLTKEGNLMKSIFSLKQEILKIDALYTLSLFAPFNVDSEENIYTSHIVKYQVHKFSSNGILLKVFPTPKNYIPPSPSKAPSPINKEEFEKWESTWHQVIGVFSVKHYILVLLRIHKPKEYRIDIYDKNGNIIRDNIVSGLKLLEVDYSGNLYFEGDSTDKGTLVMVYKCKL